MARKRKSVFIMLAMLTLSVASMVGGRTLLNAGHTSQAPTMIQKLEEITVAGEFE